MHQKTAHYTAIKLKSQEKTWAFTNYHHDITIDDTTYNSTDTIGIENIELSSTLSNTYTTFAIHSKPYANQIMQYKKQLIIEIFLLKITDEKTTLITLKRGKISEIKIENNKLIIEFHNLVRRLSNNPNMRYTTNCKTCFGDTKCQINKKDYLIENIKVISTTSNCIDVDISEAIFPQKLKNTTRNDLKRLIEQGYVILEGRSENFKIITYTQSQLKVENSDVESHLLPGDIINLQCICNKSFNQCKSIFSNQMQFRGEILLYN